MATTAITGSASGIGAATRRRLESQGDTVIGIDLRGAEIIADLCEPDSRTEAAVEVLERCSGKLDRFVACAGLGPVSGPPQRIAAVNYFGAVVLLDALRDGLAAAAPSSVVVVCSNSATTVPGIPDAFIADMLAGREAEALAHAAELGGSMAYAGSKLALSRALRRRAPEWAGRGIRLNGVAPGPIDTPLLQAGLDDPETGPLIRQYPVPTGGFGSPEQIAAAIAFLLGEEAAFCCGSILFADGGTDALVRPDSF